MLYGDTVLKNKKIQIGDEVIVKGVTKYYIHVVVTIMRS